MNQLTIRGFGEEIEREIRKMAKKEKISLNQAVLRILHQGISSPGQALKDTVIGASLDHLAGTWSEDEARVMEAVEKDFEQIDLELWT